MGFEFSEVMTGTYAMADAPGEQRHMCFDIRAHAASMFDHLRTGGETRIHGMVEMDGFADSVPLEGSLFVAPLTRRVIRYAFTFTANDGKTYRFAGQKDIKLGALRRSFTSLPGTVYGDDDQVVATAQTHFDLRADWFQFLTSWRPA